MATNWISSTNKGCTMDVRKQMKEYEAKYAELLKTLEPVLGFVPVFEFRATQEQIIAGYAKDIEIVGNLAFGHLQGVVDMIKVECEKEEMVKEAFLDAFTAKKIVLEEDPTNDTYHAKARFHEGELQLRYNPKKFSSSNKNAVDLRYGGVTLSALL